MKISIILNYSTGKLRLVDGNFTDLGVYAALWMSEHALDAGDPGIKDKMMAIRNCKKNGHKTSGTITEKKLCGQKE
jgi:hypothetical protein